MAKILWVDLLAMRNKRWPCGRVGEYPKDKRRNGWINSYFMCFEYEVE